MGDVPIFVGSDGELTETNFELKENKARDVSEREQRDGERERERETERERTCLGQRGRGHGNGGWGPGAFGVE